MATSLSAGSDSGPGVTGFGLGCTALAIAATVVVTACTSNAQDGTAPTAPKREALCEAFDDWRTDDIWPPSLTDLAPMGRDRLDTRLDGQAERLRRLAAEVERSGIDLDVRAVSASFDATASAIRERWDEDGSALLAEALDRDTEIEYVAAPDAVSDPSASQMSRTVSPLCDEPPADWTPIVNRQTIESVPPLDIVAVDIQDPTRLVRLDASGRSDEIAIEIDGTFTFSALDRKPDEDASLLINASEERDGVVTDQVFLAPVFAPGVMLSLTPPDESWACGRWSQTGEEIGVSRWRGPSTFVAGVVDFATLQIRELPAITDRRFFDTCPLVTDHGVVIAADHDLLRYVDRDAGPELIATFPDCAVLDPRFNRASGSISFLTRCTNVYEEGFYEVIPGEPPVRLLDGALGAPSWSADGRWIVFGLFDGADSQGIWIASSDGSRVAQVSEDALTWPVFLRDPS